MSQGTALICALICLTGFAQPRQISESSRERAQPAQMHRAGGQVTHPSSKASARAVIRRITGFDAIEPTLGFTDSGDLFYTAMQNSFDLRVVRSQDRGRSWEDVSPTLPGGGRSHLLGVDPYLYVDPRTSRVFTIDLTVACSFLSFSDSGGESWVTNPLGCGRAINDHQSLFAGPPVSSATVGYPNIVYYCFNDLLSSTCSKSLDGGVTFIVTGEPAFGPSRDDHSSAGCGGIHGHGVVDRRGNVYLPRELCGAPVLAISKDEGLTWTRAHVAESELNSGGADPSVAVDTAGNIYYAWVAKDRLPYLAMSRDGGATWSRPLMVGAPGITEANLLTIDVGDPGNIALAYVASRNSIFQECLRNPRCKPPRGPVKWNAFIAQSTNVLAKRPMFLSASANAPDEPVVYGPCGPGRCSSMVDFIDVEIAPDGAPWGAFVDGGNEEASEAFVATMLGAERLISRGLSTSSGGKAAGSGLSSGR